jgi:hypothetical protein
MCKAVADAWYGCHPAVFQPPPLCESHPLPRKGEGRAAARGGVYPPATRVTFPSPVIPVTPVP